MTRQTLQLIREGEYAAEVLVELHDDGGEWSPTVGPEDIKKLDRVRRALRDGNFELAEKDARVFRLVPRETGYVKTGFAENKQNGFKP
ncbi:hypothetical protein [Rhizobium sp. 18055]|jgi:hypothetical protein|uniref:hypothetical protein n=1 Tax=Rhizobium sp. 18055 TaxID=2681403 RepID=UPI00190FAE3B|nr:hypothetical protein [Rhizobium sp. 18055]